LSTPCHSQRSAFVCARPRRFLFLCSWPGSVSSYCVENRSPLSGPRAFVLFATWVFPYALSPPLRNWFFEHAVFTAVSAPSLAGLVCTPPLKKAGNCVHERCLFCASLFIDNHFPELYLVPRSASLTVSVFCRQPNKYHGESPHASLELSFIFLVFKTPKYMGFTPAAFRC